MVVEYLINHRTPYRPKSGQHEDQISDEFILFGNLYRLNVVIRQYKFLSAI